MTIFELAQEYLAYFNMNDECRWFYSDDAPLALKSIVMRVHVGMEPDDYKFQYVVESLNLIADFGEEGDLSEMMCEVEPDLYMTDLLKWLESNMDRVSYIDQVMSEGLTEEGFQRLMMYAQVKEKEEVLSIVYEQLDEYAIKLTEIEEKQEQA